MSIGAFAPSSGKVLVHGARGADDYSAWGEVQLVTPLRPDFDALSHQGYDVAFDLPGAVYAAALVQIVKSKPRSLAMLAQAYDAVVPGGPVFVDGQKPEGIESILKAVRGRVEVSQVVAKAHGKLFWFDRTEAASFEDWHANSQAAGTGYVTYPGVFSADGPDPGSEVLIALVPKLKGHVADFGSGWGYLAGEILAQQPEIKRMDMIEADRLAHKCGVKNVNDARAQHIWADVTALDEDYDAIICNPPFHSGRDTDPGLGRAFIAAAARCLKSSGRLYLVANRHLPYEAALKQAFGTGRMIAEIQGYKLYEAAKPLRGRR
ncbi:MAG: class I SAM-dependent methyltransferase [Pseudomonadota bacterium]